MSIDNTSIVIPFDNSDSARRALAFGLDLAERLELPVRLLHILDTLDTDIPPERTLSPEDLDRTGPGSQHHQRTREALEAAAGILAERNLDAEQEILAGEPAPAILEYLERCDRPMVIMGRRGRGRLPGLLVGSVSEKVVRLATCPVTVVH